MNASTTIQGNVEREPICSVTRVEAIRANSLNFGLLKFRSAQAQLGWSGKSSREIRNTLESFRQQMVEHADDLARLIAEHRHCTEAEALATEIIPLADATKFLTKRFTQILAPTRLGKKDRPSWLTGVDCEVHRQPLGLVLIISPGNYPLYLAAVQALQALAAGNAVWIKPAPGSTALLRSFKEQLIGAGLNADLMQILPESIEATQAALDSGVDKVVFTGSAETGRKILAQLAPHLTPSVMELSGCDAVFLRPDADMDLAARAIRFGLTVNNGKTCIAPRRIFVPRQLLGSFAQKLRDELQTLNPNRIDRPGSTKWLPWVKDALGNGAFIVSGTLHADHIEGPLVLSGAKPEMKLLQDDTFAPIASIVAVDSDAEALTADELCPFSLSASVFGKDVKAARHFANKVKAGTVIINDLIAPTADPRIPFGGLGQSGFGVTRGAEGLLEMTAPKVVVTNGSKSRMHYRPFKASDTELFQSLLKLSHAKTISQRIKALFRAISIFRTPTNNPTPSQS